jgi:hypothetical protein
MELGRGRYVPLGKNRRLGNEESSICGSAFCRFWFLGLGDCQRRKLVAPSAIMTKKGEDENELSKRYRERAGHMTPIGMMVMKMTAVGHQSAIPS